MEENSELLLKPKRVVNYQFKVLYALIMYVVLVGHLGVVDQYVPFVELFSPYGFGIQLFLFISGYFYNKRNDDTPHKFITKKVMTILLPYLGWNLFYGIVSHILFYCGFEYCKKMTLTAVTIDAIFKGPQYAFNGPTWFLVPFFFAEAISCLERFAFKKWEGAVKDSIIFVINLLLNFAAIHYVMKGYNAGGYYEGEFKFVFQTFFMLPYFSLGYIYKTYLEKKDTLSNTLYFLILVLLSVFYIFINGHTSSYFVVVMGGYENILFPTITAILGIAFYLRISRILTPVMGRSKCINAIADNTFAVMTHHTFAFFILSLLMILAAKLLPFLPEPNMEKFFTEVTYRYMPRGRGFPALYVIFGFAYSIYFNKLVTLIKKNIFKKEK